MIIGFISKLWEKISNFRILKRILIIVRYLKNCKTDLDRCKIYMYIIILDMLVNIVPRNYINFILKRGKQDGRIEKEDDRISWILHLVRVITHARTHAHSIISPCYSHSRRTMIDLTSDSIKSAILD